MSESTSEPILSENYLAEFGKSAAVMRERLKHEENKRKIEVGVLGKLFGSAAEKPGNIAGFAILAFALMFAGVLVWGADTPSFSKKDMLVLIGGFISLTLGFIFGRSTS